MPSEICSFRFPGGKRCVRPDGHVDETPGHHRLHETVSGGRKLLTAPSDMTYFDAVGAPHPDRLGPEGTPHGS